MNFYLILLVQFLNHTCFRGSKVLLTLFALELGASPLVAGFVFAMYSLFPALLSVLAGRVSDRVGARVPMLVGSIGLVAGMLLPFFFPSLLGLLGSAVVAGTCYIFYTVSVQHLVGSIGDGATRTRNYSYYSLCVGLTALAGPVTVGFSIESFGHAWTYFLIAMLPLGPVAILLLVGHRLPAPKRSGTVRGEERVRDLLRLPALRSVLITASIIETGNELANFLLPIYAKSVGLSPSEIGLMMGSLAVALFAVRTVMPLLVRRFSEETVLGSSLLVSAVACVLFPFMDGFWPLAGMAFVMGIGIGCGAPLSMVLVYNRTPEGRAGEAMGLRQTVNKGTEVLVPLVLGSVSTALGMWPVFWLVAAMLAFGGTVMRKEKRAAAPRAA